MGSTLAAFSAHAAPHSARAPRAAAHFALLLALEGFAQRFVAALLQAFDDDAELAVHGLLDEEAEVHVLGHHLTGQHPQLAPFLCLDGGDGMYAAADGHTKRRALAGRILGASALHAPQHLVTVATHQRDVVYAPRLLVVPRVGFSMCGGMVGHR